MWTKDYLSCVQCGQTNKRHMAKGLCTACYLKNYRNNPDNFQRISSAKRKYQINFVLSGASKIQREQLWFGGKREDILKRDNYTCHDCGEKRLSKIIVHHKDGNGRRSLNPNNADDNLITSCRACHARTHGTLNRWARDFEACVNCNTTRKRHNAKGLCAHCYSKLNYKKRG